MELLIISIAIVIAVVLIASWRHHIRLKALLNSPFRIASSLVDKLRAFHYIDDATIAGLTLFDVLYTTLKLNPAILSKFNHLDHNQGVFDMNDLATSIHNGTIFTGSTSDNWSHLGHWATETDMSIYNPVESVAAFGDDSLGNIDSALSAQDALSVSTTFYDASLDISDLGSLFYHIPIYAITIKSIRNLQKVIDDKITVSEAIEQTAVDTTSLSIGSLGGLCLGTKLGAILAPVTVGVSLVVGPLLGTVIGFISGNSISKWYKMKRYGSGYRTAQSEYNRVVVQLNSYVIELRNDFLGNFNRIERALTSRHHNNLKSTKAKWESNENFLKRLLFPNVVSMALHRSISKMKHEFRTETMPYYQKLYFEIQRLPEIKGGLRLYGQGKDKLMKIKTLDQKYDQITWTLRNIDNAKEKFLKEKSFLENKLG